LAFRKIDLPTFEYLIYFGCIEPELVEIVDRFLGNFKRFIFQELKGSGIRPIIARCFFA